MAVDFPGVLLNVDDNDGVRYVRTRILEREGYRVHEASTGSEALEKVRREAPALVLLDVNLPDMSGLEVCRQIKNDPVTAETLVLQVSARYTLSDDRVTGLKAGADAYLSAPFPADELLASVLALLRRHRRELQARGPGPSDQDQPAQPEPTAQGGSQAVTQEQIHQLATQLSVVEQRERQKLARSLHDDLAQLLAVARMKLGVGGRRNRETAVQEVDRLLEQCLDYTRSLMSELLPPAVADGRLDRALADVVNQMRQHGLTVTLRGCDHPVSLAGDVAAIVVSCVRELLFNVLKHAETGHASVSLAIHDRELRITVEDKGVGYHAVPHETAASGGFGLASVQQRMESARGRLAISSTPGVGTSATITVPYPC